MATRFYFKSLCLAMAIGLFIGCKSQVIPSTNIKSTRENKEIVSFLEEYKTALEKRNIDEIMALVAKDFKETLGSDEQTKELDYLGLKERLEKYYPRIKDLNLAIFVQHVAKLEDNIYEVVFFMNRNALIDLPSGEKQSSFKEVCRMRIRKIKDPKAPHRFEIIQKL